MRISNQLRKYIETAGVTRYKIAQETGIAQSVLSRFVHGKAGLDLVSVDRLAEFFNLSLEVGKPTARKAR